MELKDKVLRLLRERNSVSVHDEWLDACVQWILEEERQRPSEQKLYELVYEQWLHADLREVTPHPCLPSLTADKGLMAGNFIVQVISVVDVGCAAYGQLQKLKGQAIDEVDGSDKKNFDPKPTRLLLLTLTDGVSEIKAMEYSPLQQLRVDTVPGTKMLLQGEIPYRLGMLLLSADNVQVLGGRVDVLATENRTIKVLGRILNLDDEAVGHPPTATASDCVGETTPPLPASTIPETSEPHLRDQDSPCDNAGTGVSEGDLDQLGVEDLEFDEFDDFATDEDELLQAELVEQGLHSDSAEPAGEDEGKEQNSEITDENWLDYPGHDQWPEEIEKNLFDDSCQSTEAPTATLGVKTKQPSFPDSHEEEPASGTTSTARHSSCGSKSKLSLKQPSARSRVVGVTPSSQRPSLVAAVRPFQHTEDIKKDSSPPSAAAACNEEPFPIESFSSLSSEFWLSHPIVKVHARFVQVCDRIGHSDGEWVARVIIADRSGDRLTVNLSNKILEDMIGFSAVEFREHITLNRDDPLVKAKASKGFGRCQSAIAQLNCFMVISQIEPPCVVKLLDH